MGDISFAKLARKGKRDIRHNSVIAAMQKEAEDLANKSWLKIGIQEKLLNV